MTTAKGMEGISRNCDWCERPMTFDDAQGLWVCKACGAEALPPALGEGCGDSDCPDHYNGPAPYCVDAERRWREQQGGRPR